ncbi:DUF2147 domain-containing protein [Massilia sp. Dwa41.01b]|uniref:DUF2147 domain-containing protein n=1 Tax=unclassified Massilia TaxID=2609279 RepID=UPI0016011C49|nr:MULTISPECIES: DUF2147 domain-containing protein [unclassified Massilia]QNA87889.1 DUF2147 domain-containing protein [Massilia sp. Dwa41.01b]QNA98794.1 DUF2147 domain-containing protein [Massilia sp. Se16.2.3]
MRKLIPASLIATMLLTTAAWAQNPGSPVGLWKTIDDETKLPKALVRVTEENGALQGKIEKLFRGQNEDQNPKCTACTDSRKNQPIIGMTILSGLKKDGNEYSGGEILDPAKGKVYKSKATLRDGGQKMEVRGYIGMPMLGRSQIWQREQ